MDLDVASVIAIDVAANDESDMGPTLNRDGKQSGCAGNMLVVAYF